MSTYASVEDVSDRYEGQIPSTDRVQTFLDDAEVYLLGRVPDIADRITAGTSSEQAARIVVCNLVMRRLRNPAQYKGEHDGDYGYYYGSEQDWTVPTEADMNLLGISTRGAARGVGMINPALAPERTGCS
jgi:hypothetical protein